MPLLVTALKAVFYTPLYNAIVFLYNVVPGQDIGLAIIIVTVLLRVLTLPLNAASISSQKKLTELQPKLKDLQVRLKDDKEQLAKETMALYAANKVNPFASCLPVLIQLPFLIALYHALQNGLKSQGFQDLYPFVAHPGTIDAVSLGLVNLAAASWPLAILAGASQFLQARMLSTRRPPPPPTEGKKDEDMMAIMNKQMLYVMPAFTFFIAFRLPAGLALYWTVTNLLAVAQQWWLFRGKARTPAASTPVASSQ